MRERLRFATEEEVNSIKDKADLSPDAAVVALDTPKGAILMVLRTVAELDPVFFPEGIEDRYKLLAIRDAETFMFSRMVGSYYFNIKDSDERWKAICEHYGAKSISEAPEIRFKKALY